jgi:hypothetical protein
MGSLFEEVLMPRCRDDHVFFTQCGKQAGVTSEEQDTRPECKSKDSGIIHAQTLEFRTRGSYLVLLLLKLKPSTIGH